PTREWINLAGIGQSIDGERLQSTSNNAKQADSTSSRAREASSSRAPMASRSGSAADSNRSTDNSGEKARPVPYKSAKVASILRAFRQKMRKGCNIKEAALEIADDRGESFASVERTIYRYRGILGSERD